MAIVFTVNRVWPCEELRSAPLKGKREMGARRRRFPLLTQNEAKNNRRHVQQAISKTKKKICVTLYSACLQLLFIIFEYLPPCVLHINSILWYRNLGYRRLMGVFNFRFELNHEGITS